MKKFPRFPLRSAQIHDNWKTMSRDILRGLGSLKLTVVLMALMILLVFFGTIGQVHLGTWLAQKKYFSSWLIFAETGSGARFPVFPGGYTIGGFWLVNLLVAHISRFAWNRKRAGILLTHAGLFILLSGQGLTQMFSVESQMAIDEGGARNYAEDTRDTELAVIDVSPAEHDEVHVLPSALLAREDTLAPAGLPFAVTVKRFFPNAELKAGGASVATRGVGLRVSVEDSPVATADDESNNVSALIELKTETENLGTWLVSTGLGAPQTVVSGGREFRLEMRARRYYHPFTLHLKDFRHDVYPGTDIPKNFSSLLRLVDPSQGEDRDVLVYMNNPLRYRGLTFFQASFGKEDTLSVLQVVRNPVWVAPYLACILVTLGLAIQFGMHLLSFRRRTA